MYCKMYTEKNKSNHDKLDFLKILNILWIILSESARYQKNGGIYKFTLNTHSLENRLVQHTKNFVINFLSSYLLVVLKNLEAEY